MQSAAYQASFGLKHSRWITGRNYCFASGCFDGDCFVVRAKRERGERKKLREQQRLKGIVVNSKRKFLLLFRAPLPAVFILYYRSRTPIGHLHILRQFLQEFREIVRVLFLWLFFETIRALVGTMTILVLLVVWKLRSHSFPHFYTISGVLLYIYRVTRDGESR